jgi:ent-kaurenoic acid hydroxylase
MEAADCAWWLGLLFGAAPLLALAFWHCADAYYRMGSNLPPGHMGLPFVGDTLALLWYFKVVRRPDEFIAAKKRRYGDDQVAMYRTHLFGSPTVLVCSPEANKFVLQSPESFGIRWPAPEIIGLSSVANVEGSQHARLRGFVNKTRSP